MSWINNHLSVFYEIDQTTYLLIAFFCGCAAYFVRARLLNTAVLVFLVPVFCALAFGIYGAVLYLEIFSPKKQADWIIYSVVSAALGCGIGILLLSIYRRFQDVAIESAHGRRMARREAEKAAELEQTKLFGQSL